MYDIFCVGGSSLDLILRTPRLPKKDEKLVVDLCARAPGGFIANTACASARLGCRTGWSGILGNDDFGHIMLDDFKAFGVDCTLAEIQEGGTTDFCIILLDDTGERTILVVPTTHSHLSFTAERLAALTDTHIAYTFPHEPSWFTTFSNSVQSRGGWVAVDIEGSSPVRGEALDDVIRRSDVVFCSLDGLQLACATRIPEEGGKLLLALGARQVIVTLGSQGAFSMDAHNEVRVKGRNVEVLDTTGAGDCFHAAYMTAIIKGWTMERSLQFANCAASISVQHLGARGGLPDFYQVIDTMEKNT